MCTYCNTIDQLIIEFGGSAGLLPKLARLDYNNVRLANFAELPPAVRALR
jgi:hypothetical protein